MPRAKVSTVLQKLAHPVIAEGFSGNRWRHFRELAQKWHELAALRDFLVVLRSMNVTPTDEIDGRSVEEWIAWADEWLQRADPTAGGVGSVFEQIAGITDWTYRD